MKFVGSKPVHVEGFNVYQRRSCFMESHYFFIATIIGIGFVFIFFNSLKLLNSKKKQKNYNMVRMFFSRFKTGTRIS